MEWWLAGIAVYALLSTGGLAWGIYRLLGRMLDLRISQENSEQIIMQLGSELEDKQDLWYTRMLVLLNGKEAWNLERAQQLVIAYSAARAMGPQIDRIDRDIKALGEADNLMAQRMDKAEASIIDMIAGFNLGEDNDAV